MKLRRCDWVPLSVAKWLCEELDERGIPGTTYSHTLLSLLHPHFCPHPLPKDSNYSSKCLVHCQSLRSSLVNSSVRDFEFLFEEFEQAAHPDADFPDLTFPEYQKTGSKKAKKKLKKKIKELNKTPEKKWKAVAIQCLESATDDKEFLKSIVDDLFEKLNDLKELNSSEDIDSAFSDSSECLSDFEPKPNLNNTKPLLTSNFPPLATPPIDPFSRLDLPVDWKGLIKNKLSPQKPTEISCSVLINPDDVKRNLNLDFNKIEKRHEMEISSNQFTENPQLDLSSSHFLPINNPDANSFFSSEPTYDDVFESSQESQSECVEGKLEGWECAPILPSRESREASVDLLGSRLFERSMAGSDNNTRCNSISELEEERMKNLEKSISHSAAQLWGQNSTVDSWQTKPTDFVWGASMVSPHYPGEPQMVNSWTVPDGGNWNTESDRNLNSVIPLSKSWSANADWGSRALLNSTNDPYLSSAREEETFLAREPFREKDSDDPAVFGVSKGRVKDIWSDCNDNDVPASRGISENLHRKRSIDSDNCNQFQKDNSEERLCESFRSLGLEHLWQDPLASARETVVPRGRDSVVESERQFSAEDLFSIRMKFEEEVDPNYFAAAIPSGPTGPYVELKHTESSGFSTVVPHKTNEGELLNDELLLMNAEGGGEASCDPEEENLLTSPRTHFRPIRQDSNGSVQEDSKSEESQAILNVVSGMQDANLVFQRTNSGTLFLESDVIEGSPKKYMIYREPSVKPNLETTTNEFSLITHQPQPSLQTSSSFVPKFKIINNEKFCQTEEGSSICLGQNLDKELMSLKIFNSLTSSSSSSTSDSIWKPEQANNLKMLWVQDSAAKIPPKKEAWELAMDEQSLSSLPKWSTNDWNKESSGLGDYPIDTSSFAANKTDDSFSKIKFIWHDSVLKTPPKERGPRNSGSHPVSRPEKMDSFMSATSNPWNPQVEPKLPPESVKPCSEPLWRLQWEVDQEAEELLGGLPSMPLKATPTEEGGGSAAAAPLHNDEKEELIFANFFEGQDINQSVEDLENLEPGWDLNEGFEWGPASEDQQGDEEEREVLVYENEDGQTVMVPVEYIDDSLYDEIFGCESNIPIGGSLPDLPHGHMAELKKLSRRSKGTRFVPPSRRPCSFYLEGNCRRSDCKFSHDLTAITCRFWEEGSCLKGETCPFRHGIAPETNLHSRPRRRNRSEGDQASLLDSFNLLKDGTVGVSKSRPIPRKNRGSSASMSSFEIDSETDFPCLGSSLESKSGSLEETTLGAAMKAAKLTKKKKKFIAVAKTTAKDSEVDVKLSHGGKISKAERRKAKNVKMSTISDNLELTKKRGVRDKEKSECGSLRKVLRKRHVTAPQQSPNRHDDGTLSDF